MPSKEQVITLLEQFVEEACELLGVESPFEQEEEENGQEE